MFLYSPSIIAAQYAHTSCKLHQTLKIIFLLFFLKSFSRFTHISTFSPYLPDAFCFIFPNQAGSAGFH